MRLVRLPDWPERLDQLIAARRDTQFLFGSFDCALFACDAVLAMTDTDIAASYRGSYSDMKTASQLLREKNLFRIALEVAEQFEMERIQYPWAAPRGSVLMIYRQSLIGYTLAVSDGKYALAPLESGLAHVSLNLAARAWKV